MFRTELLGPLRLFDQIGVHPGRAVLPVVAANNSPSAGGIPDPSGNAAGGEHPLDRLTRDCGDEVEVVVVVQHHEPGGFGRGGDEEVGDLCSSLLTPGRERVLHGDGSVENSLIHRNERPPGSLLAHCSM